MTSLRPQHTLRSPSSVTAPFTQVSQFPHAVLEVKLQLVSGTQQPDWVSELLASGYLREMPKFSKFVHGARAPEQATRPAIGSRGPTHHLSAPSSNLLSYLLSHSLHSPPFPLSLLNSPPPSRAASPRPPRRPPRPGTAYLNRAEIRELPYWWGPELISQWANIGLSRPLPVRMVNQEVGDDDQDEAPNWERSSALGFVDSIGAQLQVGGGGGGGCVVVRMCSGDGDEVVCGWRREVVDGWTAGDATSRPLITRHCQAWAQSYALAMHRPTSARP